MKFFYTEDYLISINELFKDWHDFYYNKAYINLNNEEADNFFSYFYRYIFSYYNALYLFIYINFNWNYYYFLFNYTYFTDYENALISVNPQRHTFLYSLEGKFFKIVILFDNYLSFLRIFLVFIHFLRHLWINFILVSRIFKNL